jgi:hypothetical protein
MSHLFFKQRGCPHYGCKRGGLRNSGCAMWGWSLPAAVGGLCETQKLNHFHFISQWEDADEGGHSGGVGSEGSGVGWGGG